MKYACNIIFALTLTLILTGCGSDSNIDDDTSNPNDSSGTAFTQLSSDYSNILNASKPIQNLRYRCEEREIGVSDSLQFTTGTTTIKGEFTCDAGMSNIIFYLGTYPDKGENSHYDIANVSLGPLEKAQPNVITLQNLYNSERSSSDQQVINAGRVLYAFETGTDFVIPETAHYEVGSSEAFLSSKSPFTETAVEILNDYFARVGGTQTFTKVTGSVTETITTNTLSLVNEFNAAQNVKRVESIKRAGIYNFPLVDVEIQEDGSAVLVIGQTVFFLATRENEWVGSGLVSVSRDGKDFIQYYVSNASTVSKLLDNGTMDNFSVSTQLSSQEESGFTVNMDGRFFENKVYSTEDAYREDYNEAVTLQSGELGTWFFTDNTISDAELPVEQFTSVEFDLDINDELYPLAFAVDILDNSKTTTIESEFVLLATKNGNIYYDNGSVACEYDNADTLVGLQVSSGLDGEDPTIRFELVFANLENSTVQGLFTLLGQTRLSVNTKDKKVVQVNSAGDVSEAIWQDLKKGLEIAGYIFTSDNQPCD